MDQIREEAEFNALVSQMEETGVRVEIHVFGYYLDGDGNWQKDPGTYGHVSIRVTSADGSIEYAYASHFPDPDGLLGVKKDDGKAQHTYDDDVCGFSNDFEGYDHEIIIDITSGFGSIEDVARLATAINNKQDSGPWLPFDNCGNKVAFDLGKGNFQGGLPTNPNYPKHWLIWAQTEDYPMEFRERDESKSFWNNYRPPGY